MRVLLVWNGAASRADADPGRRNRVPLLAAIASCGVDTMVALLDDRGWLGDELAARGIPVFPLPAGLPPRPSGLAGLPGASFALRRIIQAQRPDVIDASHPLPAIAAALAATGTNTPVCYRRHHAGGRPPLIAASRIAARLASRIVVSNDVMRACASTQDRISPDRIDVTSSGIPEPPAVEPRETAALRVSLGLEPHTHVILAVGRLRFEKGFDVLLDAANLLGRDDVQVVLLGEGPEGGDLRARAARARLPVHMPGHVAEVHPWLSLASIVVMPSRRESFGQATLEAMAAGAPIVASRVGGLQVAIADGESGLLVPPDDPAALAAAVTRLLDNPDARHALGAAARRRYLDRYTIDHMAASWAEAWRRLVESRGGHA